MRRLRLTVLGETHHLEFDPHYDIAVIEDSILSVLPGEPTLDIQDEVFLLSQRVSTAWESHPGLFTVSAELEASREDFT